MTHLFVILPTRWFFHNTRFFISNTFISNARQNFRSSRPDLFCKKGVLRNFAKLTGKYLGQSRFFNKVAGLRPELLLFQNYSHSSSMSSSKNNRTYCKTKQQNKYVCIHETIRLIKIKIKAKKVKNRSHRSDISKPRFRHEPKCSKYKVSH